MVFIIEACGLLCITISYSIIIFSNFTFIKVWIDNYRENDKQPGLGFYLNLIVYEALVVLMVCAHIRTMITDPGYITLGITEYEI